MFAVFIKLTRVEQQENQWFFKGVLLQAGVNL